MRIAYIIEKLSGKGGMERILTDKMNYLVEHTANEVVLILLWHDDKPMAYPLSARVRVIRLNVPFGVPLIGYPMLWWRFREYIRKVNPDVTVYTWVAGAFLACYGGWKGNSVFENHHTLSDMRHNGLVRRASRLVNCVVALSDSDAEAFKDVKHLEVIPNFTTIHGVSADYDARHCLAIGRFVDVKNYRRMVGIWRQIASRYPGWTLDIVGEGPEKDDIKAMIEKDGLTESIVLHPATDNVAEYYSHSSIYLLTSKSEGLPMVLIEAQACGLPVVAFDCDFGPRQIITDGRDGYLIHYDDDQGFIDTLSLLMDDDARRRKMGDAAKMSSRRYLPSSVMAQWLRLFARLCSLS